MDEMGNVVSGGLSSTGAKRSPTSLGPHSEIPLNHMKRYENGPNCSGIMSAGVTEKQF